MQPICKISLQNKLQKIFLTKMFAFARFVSVTSKKSPNVYKSCPKIISLTLLQKFPKNVGNLSKIIVAKGFEKLPKVQ